MSENGLQAVGAYLRYLRESRGLSIAQIGTMVEIDPSQVWRIEGGKADSRSSILFRFIGAVGGDPSDVALLINNPAATREIGESIAKLRYNLNS